MKAPRPAAFERPHDLLDVQEIDVVQLVFVGKPRAHRAPQLGTPSGISLVGHDRRRPGDRLVQAGEEGP